MVGAPVSAAREAILARIAAVERGPAAGAARGYRRAGALSQRERVALFCERVSDYRAEARTIQTTEVAEAVETVCREHRAVRVGLPQGLPAEWRPRSLETIEDHGGLSPLELDSLDAVITGCTVAIAETGTIALAGGPLEGRRALTLVPDLHICVVREEQVVELVPEAITHLAQLVGRERRPVTLVSGPSATSDIELSRVEGVHGPRTLVVLIATNAQL